MPFADAMLVRLPDGLAPEVAAGASDNITDAYRAVAPHLAIRPGAPVLVCGGALSGSIGLYAVAEAIALGLRRLPVCLTPDPGRRAIAESYGARTLDHLPDPPRPRALPITIDANALS